MHVSVYHTGPGWICTIYMYSESCLLNISLNTILRDSTCTHTCTSLADNRVHVYLFVFHTHTHTQEAFRHIDLEIPERLIRISREAGVPHCSLLTSTGSNSNSWFLYLKTKGQVNTSACPIGQVNTSTCLIGQINTSACPIGQVNTPACPIGQVNTSACPIGQVNTSACPIGQVNTPACPIGQVNTPACPIGQVNTPACPIGQVNTPACLECIKASDIIMHGLMFLGWCTIVSNMTRRQLFIDGGCR